MYVRGDTNDIDLLMVFLLAQNIVLSTVSTPLELLHFYFLFSFTFFLPFLLTFLTFSVVQTVRCQLCQHPGGFVAVPRFMGLCSPGEKPGKTIMWNILFVRLFVYLLAISEYEEFFFEFVKRPLSSPTLFWTVIVQVLTAGTQESGKKI